MMVSVSLACQSEIIEMALASILPMRLLEDTVRRTSKYKRIEASIRELGLIEPLVVFPQPNSNGCFMLLDGHVRLMILKSLGATTAKCLISTDDEGFTYNHKVNRLTAIQEHFMILRAIKNGVTEDRIARSLNVDVQNIRQKRDLLEGICHEAVHLLREKQASASALRELRKVKPMRQIAIAELMSAAGNYSAGYAKCLTAATPVDQLVDGERAKEIRGLSPEDIARMEHELDSLGQDFKLIEESHGKNVLNLVLVAGYLRKLLENPRVARHLSHHHPEVLAEFQKLVEARNLGDGVQTNAAAE
jgi:hypothetical protein